MSTPRPRTRIATDYSELPVKYTNSNVAGVYDLPWKTFRFYDSIVDTVGTSKSQRVKPVKARHIRYTGNAWSLWNADHGYTVSNVSGATPFMDVNWFGVDLPEPDASSLNEASMKAFNSFSERFPERVSASEFTQGMLELKALLPKFERSILATLSGGHLTNQFGWQNLLADLRTMSSALKGIEDRMQFLLKTKGKPTKLFYAQKDFFKPGIPERVVENQRGISTKIVNLSYRYDFRASCTLVQDLQHIRDEIGWFRAIAISLGLTNPLKRIWEVLPMSFVIDWFLNVSGHLDRVARINPAEQWDLYNQSYSWKFYGGFAISDVHTNLVEQSDQDIPVGRVNCSYYVRSVGLPLRLDGLINTNLSPSQLLLMLAMAGAKQ